MPVAMSKETGSEAIAPPTLEELFTACEGPLLRYAYKLTRDADASQEIVQESFMKLHTQFDNVQQPRPWLYRTVHNQALNRLRREKKIVSLYQDENGAEAAMPDPSTISPDEHVARLEAIEMTKASLKGLDERGRELVRLKFEEGLSYKEISKATGLSVSNVGYVLHHTLKRLADDLEKSGVTL